MNRPPGGLIPDLYHISQFCILFPGQLFDDCQNIALLYDDIFLVIIKLDFCAGIFGINDLIANLDFHLDLLAVNHAAGAYSDNFCLLGLLFFLAGKDDAGLGCSLSFQLL